MNKSVRLLLHIRQYMKMTSFVCILKLESALLINRKIVSRQYSYEYALLLVLSNHCDLLLLSRSVVPRTTAKSK